MDRHKYVNCDLDEMKCFEKSHRQAVLILCAFYLTLWKKYDILS